MKNFFLQVGDVVQKGISGASQKTNEELGKAKEFSDIPGYTEEKQTAVDENQVNQAFEPANNIFDSLREAGDWVFDIISDFFSQLFGNIS